jgi:hypothetical protein
VDLVLPAEFRGLAWVLRNQAFAADREATTALRLAALPLQRRMAGGHRTLRHEQVGEAEATWRRQMQARFQVGAVAVWWGERSITVCEWRISASGWWNEAWGHRPRHRSRGSPSRRWP